MTSAPAADANIGRTLAGQYRIEAWLGQGGMGRVYRGVQLSVKRAVAIKLITGALPHPPEWAERFRREAEATARLSHPNTVRLFDFGVTEAQELFIVMELLEGTDLARELRARGPLAIGPALDITRQVLLALSEAHALGVVHRDIKPDNVFLARVHGGAVVAKVMDFGIADLERASVNSRLTGAGVIVGTPAYMSPEQAQGLAVDARSDLYSVGIMLFELLTGQQPFASHTAVALIIAHVTQPPRRLSDVGVHVAQQAGVQALLDGLLAKEPHERPSIAAALTAVAALASAVAGAAQDSALDWPSESARSRSRRLATPLATEVALRGSVADASTVHARHGSRFLVLAAGAVLSAAVALLLQWAPTLSAATQQLRDSVSAPEEAAAPSGAPFRVTIASRPAGASVMHNGRELGTTPFTGEWRAPVDVSLVRRGYERRLLHVAPGDAALTVDLVRDVPPEVASSAALASLQQSAQAAITALSRNDAAPAHMAAGAALAPGAAHQPQPSAASVSPLKSERHAVSSPARKARGWLGPPLPAANPAPAAQPEPEPADTEQDPPKPCVVGRALARALGRLLLPTPVATRQQALLSEPMPYATVRAARSAYDERAIDRDRFDETIWLLRQHRRERMEAERDKLARGEISQREYDAHSERIAAEFWGR